jgi:hypothetical protein
MTAEKFSELCKRLALQNAGEFPLETIIKTVVENCAVAAELHARSFSDGDAGSGAHGAANAVRAYGKSLFK